MPIFRRAAIAYNDSTYEAVVTKYEDRLSKRFQLLMIK
jgi:hypothetical protein